MTCAHHFVFEPPTAGRISVGVCKHCGERKEGNNYGLDDDELARMRHWHMTSGKAYLMVYPKKE